MQPDPKVFLPAIRRQVLRDDLFGDALQSGLSPILMHRAGEGLVQLALRYGELPAMLRKLRSPQRSMLKRAAALLQSAGIELPQKLAEAAAFAAPRGVPGEADVRGYDILVEGVAAGIAALSADGKLSAAHAAALAKLCRSASGLEIRMRSAYKAALERVKAAIDRDEPIAEVPAVEPTDAAVTALLRRRFPQSPAIEARRVRRLPGINAQEIFFFELMNHPQWEGPMVLRRAAGFNPTQSSIADEFDLLNYLHAHAIPVPQVLLVERDPAVLGGTCLMMRRLPGSAKTPETVGADGRAVALAMAGILAQIHRIDVSELTGPHRDDGRSIAVRMQTLIDKFYRRWQSERIETSLALESAFAWMRSNIGCLEGRVSLVHGDCNFRNILLDGSRVSALLDWELSHPGHAAEDSAYIRPDVEKVVPWTEFHDAYIAAGGARVSEQALRYFEVWTNVWRTSMAACVYAGYIRGAHRNFIFATVAFHEYYTTLDDLCAFMAGAG